jgi:hypothetical protein
MFDTTPQGYVRSTKKGWLVPARTPQKAKLDKLTQENAELKARLDAIEALLAKEKDNE